MQKIDLTGKIIDHLTVIKEATKEERIDKKQVYYWCQCDCGRPDLILKQARQLREDKNLCCKECSYKYLGEKKIKDITNQTFGKLTAKKCVGKDNWRNALWECQCNCGNIIIVAEGDLIKHKKLSCGCDIVKSKGEKRIIELLTQYNIPFEQQKIFESCKFETNYPAYFDFFVDNKYLIEYDGEQHYYGWYEQNNSLKENQKRDEIKNLWCIEHNIPLIRIPFTQLHFLTIEDLQLETSNFVYFTP